MPHKIQKIILKNLLLNQELRFSELNSESISSDHFSFHVKQLVTSGVVLKGEDGLYRLTSDGKEYANRFDIDGKEIKLEKQAKLGILVVACENGKYLIQQRLKQPYYGYHGFVTGKIKWGEAVYEAATRELKEEAGLHGEFVFKGIEHKRDYTPEGKLLEDKYFYIVKATSLSGNLQEKFDSGRNFWASNEEIMVLADLFGDVPKIIKAVEQDSLVFFEDKYTIKRY